MNLSSDEIESLRLNPAKPVTFELLETFVNQDSPNYYVRECYPDSPFRFVGPEFLASECPGSLDLYFQIDLTIRQKNYRRLFALMRFYRVEAFMVVVQSDRCTLVDVVKHFPFKCFSVLSNLFADYTTPFFQWTIAGRMQYFLETLVLNDKISDRDFDYLMGAIPWKGRITMDDVVTTICGIDRLHRQDYCSYVRRLYRLLDHLSDTFAFRESSKYPLLSDPFLLRHYPFQFLYYGFMPDSSMSTIFSEYRHKPKWSRAIHPRTPVNFKRQTITILCMQRFRSKEFPVHRNVLDIILSHLWTMECQCLEDKMSKIKNRIAELKNLYESGPRRKAIHILLRRGIVIENKDNPYNDFFNLAVLESGDRLDEQRTSRYKLLLFNQIILYWQGMLGLIEKIANNQKYDRLFQTSPDGTSQEKTLNRHELIADKIFQYCVEKNLDLIDVREGLIDISQPFLESLEDAI